MSPSASSPEADALDILIAQEQSLFDAFQLRRTNADGTSAAAVTGALALAGLTATAAQTIKHIDTTYAWAVTIVLAFVFVLALAARFYAGLHVQLTRRSLRLTSRSLAYSDALADMRGYEKGPRQDPVEARRLALVLVRCRADDAQSIAEAKERWAASVMVALVVGVVMSVALGLTIIS
ncbi:MAG: hypothetical protein ABSC56_10185 [Solirubrobacteraceae bacterium]